MPQPTVIDRLTDAFGTCEGITLSAEDVQDVMSRLTEAEDALIAYGSGVYEVEGNGKFRRIVNLREKVA